MTAKVLAAAQDCGYEPDVLARSLRSGASMSVGVIVGDISNPLIAHITLGIETVLAEAGFTSLLANSLSSADREAELVRLFRQRRVDGLLVSITDESHVAMREELTRFARPCIFLDRTVEELPRASSVLFDHRTGFREAAEHLIRLGHRKIAFIGGSDRVWTTRERFAGLESAIAGVRGVNLQSALGSLSRAHGESATASLLASANPPTAIICAGNQILPGVLAVISARSLRTPEHLSIVTTDRIDLAELFCPPLATITRDPEEMGRMAANQLLQQLNGASAVRIILPTKFEPAASCAAPPTRP
jgi:LacI family transcriptional regulator